MQITATAPSPVIATTPAPLGRALQWDGHANVEVDVFAGRTVLSGAADIAKAGSALIAEGFNGGLRRTEEPVLFVRNGDAWDAVELLTKRLDGTPTDRDWAPITNLQQGAVAPKVGGMWVIGDYGGDYTHWLTDQAPA